VTSPGTSRGQSIAATQAARPPQSKPAAPESAAASLQARAAEELAGYIAAGMAPSTGAFFLSIVLARYMHLPQANRLDLKDA
jgi:hypothetical protein